MKARILCAVPLYYGWVRMEVALFLAQAGAPIFPVYAQPIPAARNAIIHEAKRRQVDVVLMVDHDADPAPGTFDTLVNKALSEPCVVGVPFVTQGGAVAVSTKEDPLTQTGIKAVEMVGTHVCAYNVKVFDRIDPPYYEQHYNAEHTAITDTEDSVCHKKLAARGVTIYCAWDHWAAHWRETRLDKPRRLDIELFGKHYRQDTRYQHGI